MFSHGGKPQGQLSPRLVFLCTTQVNDSAVLVSQRFDQPVFLKGFPGNWRKRQDNCSRIY